jgi:hypothetical protein
MIETTEKAILAGDCFWGMQDLLRKRPDVISTRVGYTAATSPTRAIATTARTPRRSRSSSTTSRSATDACTGSHADAARTGPHACSGSSRRAS